MKNISTASPSALKRETPLANHKAQKDMKEARLRLNEEGLIIFNRLARFVALTLLLAAAVQQSLFNRLLNRFEQKVETHTASIQQTNQLLLREIKQLGSDLTAVPSPGFASTKGLSSEKESLSLSVQEVIVLQTHLNQHGFHPGNLEGHLDKKTLQAVEDFQKAKNLPSGTLDVITLQHLGIEKPSNFQ